MCCAFHVDLPKGDAEGRFARKNKQTNKIYQVKMLNMMLDISVMSRKTCNIKNKVHMISGLYFINIFTR